MVQGENNKAFGRYYLTKLKRTVQMKRYQPGIGNIMFVDFAAQTPSVIYKFYVIYEWLFLLPVSTVTVIMLTLAPVMACFLTAPSHHLNQCWTISKVPWQPSECIIITRAEDINQRGKIGTYSPGTKHDASQYSVGFAVLNKFIWFDYQNSSGLLHW